MLRKIFNHLVAPKLDLIAASTAASKMGLKAFQVVGSNMAPTVPAEHMAWYRPLTSIDGLQRGALLVVKTDALGDVLVPSRLIGLPGESVELREGRLLVNGMPIAEPYIAPERAEQDYSLHHPRTTVPGGHAWVMGDFRDMSKDSRHVGPLPGAAIVGLITHLHPAGHHERAQAHAASGVL